jgi:GNAT superfamily N-acetyltransferase
MQDPVDLSIRQFTDAWQVFCANAPHRAVATADGVQYVFSGIPIAFFNIALPTGRDIAADALQAHARAACEFASPRGVPWFFVVTHERLAPGTDATAILDSCGLAPIMPLTGMLAQQIAPAASIPTGLELTLPDDDDGYSAVIDVNAVAYDMELDASKPLIGRRAFWTDHVAVLGKTGGKPASSAAVLMVEGYRYVALVATDPGQQRRGYAEAAMRRALDHAAAVHGERPTVLHATAAGRPIYARMGYETIANHTVFMEKTFLSGH